MHSLTSAFLLCLGLSSALGTLALAATAPGGPKAYLVYVGTYTGPGSRGIYLSRLDTVTGHLEALELAAETPNPTFLALHPNGRFLYAANEIGEFGAKPTGSVTGYSIDPSSGHLTRLNSRTSAGGGPCHLVVDPSGRNVIVANYGGGSVGVLPVGVDGTLGEPSARIQHQGSSINPHRQEGPHAHGVVLDASNQRAYVTDLGLDRVMIYQLSPQEGSLRANDPAFAATKAGAGPRHMVFDARDRFAYVINEMENTVTVFFHTAGQGALTAVQTVPTLPAGFRGESTTAEVEIHPSGRFLYGSNRGHDSIAIFRIDPTKGTLTPLGHQSTGGKMPRNFAIDPSGRFLIACNQASNTMVVFKVDLDSGKLTPTGQTLEVGAPVCVKYLPVL